MYTNLENTALLDELVRLPIRLVVYLKSDIQDISKIHAKGLNIILWLALIYAIDVNSPRYYSVFATSWIAHLNIIGFISQKKICSAKPVVGRPFIYILLHTENPLQMQNKYGEQYIQADCIHE